MQLDVNVVYVGNMVDVYIRCCLFVGILTLLVNERLGVNSISFLRLVLFVFRSYFLLLVVHIRLNWLVLLLDEFHYRVVVDFGYKPLLRSNQQIFNQIPIFFAGCIFFLLALDLHVGTFK